MTSRPDNTVRIVAARIPRDGLFPYLRAIGWNAPVPEITRTALNLVDLATSFSLSLDLAPDVRGRIGIECFVLPCEAPAERWRALLGYLEDLGLCLSAKAAAFRAWEGVCERTNSAGAWPGQLTWGDRLLCPQMASVIARFRSHVKLVVEPSGELWVKGYAGFAHCSASTIRSRVDILPPSPGIAGRSVAGSGSGASDDPVATASSELDWMVRAVAQRALFLFERAAYVTAEQQRTGASAPDRRDLDRWARACSRGDEAKFQKRLAWDGLDLETDFRLVTELDRDEIDVIPAWPATVRRIIEGCRAVGGTTPVAGFADRRPDDPPFADALRPIVRIARRTLEERLGANAGDDADRLLARLAPEAFVQLEFALLTELSYLSARALYAEFLRPRPAGQSFLLAADIASADEPASSTTTASSTTFWETAFSGSSSPIPCSHG